jgi:hypothetical protein
LHTMPTEEERPKLAAYLAGLPGRLARLPRVEAIPRKGQSEEVETNLPFPAMDTFPRPIRVETQFLLHDVSAFSRICEQLAVLLQKPIAAFSTDDRAILRDWLLYEVRYAAGCTLSWKPLRPSFAVPLPPATVAVAESAGRVVDISDDSDDGMLSFCAVFLGIPDAARKEAAGDSDCIIVEQADTAKPNQAEGRMKRDRRPSAKALRNMQH